MFPPPHPSQKEWCPGAFPTMNMYICANESSLATTCCGRWEWKRMIVLAQLLYRKDKKTSHLVICSLLIAAGGNGNVRRIRIGCPESSLKVRFCFFIHTHTLSLALSLSLSHTHTHHTDIIYIYGIYIYIMYIHHVYIYIYIHTICIYIHYECMHGCMLYIHTYSNAYIYSYKPK
jgi:hypothetical protein